MESSWIYTITYQNISNTLVDLDLDLIQLIAHRQSPRVNDNALLIMLVLDVIYPNGFNS